MSYVYILESLTSGKYYIGSTENVEARLKKHNSRQVFSTKPYVPYKLAFKQKFENISEARRIEVKLKRLKRKDYIRKIIENRKIELRAISSFGRATDS